MRRWRVLLRVAPPTGGLLNVQQRADFPGSFKLPKWVVMPSEVTAPAPNLLLCACAV